MLNQERIGGFMAELRKSKNMTQEQLAEKLGVSNRSISRWENGKTMPDLSMLPLIGEEFGVSISELLEGKCKENGEDFKKSAALLMELSYEEKRRKAKKVSLYFLMGLLCIAVAVLHSLYGILEFSKKPEQLSLVCLLLGIGFEAAGFYCNSKDRKYSPREIEILSEQDPEMKMKTAEEMLQFARKYQKAEFKQYEKAFQTIEELLPADETVGFAMVADEFTVNEMSGGLWHLGIAVTKENILIAGEKITGRVMVRYGTEEISLKEIKYIGLDGRMIVIRMEKNEIKLHGENLKGVLKKFQESCMPELV